MSESFKKKQHGVMSGGGLAMLITTATLVLPLVFPSMFPRVPDAFDERLTMWATAAALNCFWMLVGIGRLANHRFFNAADIDSAATAGSAKPSQNAVILGAILTNTTEQVLVSTITYGSYLILAPAHSPAYPLLLCVLFSVGRLFFFAQYEQGAAGRAFGFGLTFYGTALLLVATVLMALRRWAVVVGMGGGGQNMN